MSQFPCKCETVETVKVPVRGLSLDFEADAIGGLKEADVQAMIDRSLALNPGGGIIPDFRVGVETLYPGRYNGKQMYAQLIDFGQLPNATSKVIQHGIPDVEWIMVSEHLSQVRVSGDGSYRALTFGHPEEASNNWFYAYSDTTFTIFTGYDRRLLSATVCFLYTKRTDPVNN